MATFSTNQVRQMYVVSANAAAVTDASAVGTIAVSKGKSAGGSVDHSWYFTYKGQGGVLRSDIIPAGMTLQNIKITPDSKMTKALKKYKLVVNDNPVAGQDYIVRFIIRQYISLSEEDQMCKHALVHATTGMTKTQFYTALKESAEMNFSRDSDNFFTFSADANGFYIQENEPYWELGKFQQKLLDFTVQPTTITVNSEEVNWGTVTSVTGVTLQNGKQIADMEYFYMGERADIYRGMGYPYNLDTAYVVNPSHKYATIDISFAFQGPAEDIQKSPRVLTLAVDTTSALTVVNAVIDAIELATGLTIPALT